MNILVVSPHLDDETIGAGGALLRFAAQGHATYWLNIANTKEEYGYAPDTVLARARQQEEVAQALGFARSYDLALRPAALDTYDEGAIIPRIAEVMLEVAPDVLILPHEGDVHSDHGRVCRWLRPFTKSFRYPRLRTVLAMEILSETDFAVDGQGFVPNYFVDISDSLERKIEVACLYEGEIPERDFPRSAENLRALARLRGAVAGVRYAEGFRLLRHIEKE
jgi:LmbE family N-acetylglucosaminyl deacetylase